MIALPLYRCVYFLVHCWDLNLWVVPRIEESCILLHKLSYPDRLEVMKGLFGRQFTVLSRVVFAIPEVLYSSYQNISTISSSIITRELLQSWTDAIQTNGYPLKRCFTFFDRTVRTVSRSSYNQKLRLKWTKAVPCPRDKFQSVPSPNGLIVDVIGPC